MSDFHGAKPSIGHQCTANPSRRMPAVLCEARAIWLLPCVPAGYFCAKHALEVAAEHGRDGCKAGG